MSGISIDGVQILDDGTVLDGTIINAERIKGVGSRYHTVVRGNVYGDRKGRFFDGDYIRTSYVVTEEQYNGYSIVRTRNSVYRVEYRDAPAETSIYHVPV